jgi:4-amino-4-deoxy-L-arabinose transferase-like glycosyltransferase
MQSLVDSRPDPYYFSAMGRSLANGDGFAGYGEVLHRRGPLYPLMLGAIYTVFGQSVLLVQVVQCFLHAGTCYFACKTGRHIFNARSGLLAGLLCAVNPSLLRYVPDFHLEALLIFVTTLAVWRSVRLHQNPSIANAALFGVTSALSALTKPTLLLYPVFFLALWGVLGGSKFRIRRRWLIGAVVALAMGVAIGPWTVRNYFATGGRFVLITTGASDAILRSYIFTKPEYATLQKLPYVDAENEANAMFKRICEEHGTVWGPGGLDDVDLDQLLHQVARERILSDPLAFVRKSLVGVFTFWYEMTTALTSAVAGLLALTAWSLTLVGLPRARREARPIWILFIPVLYMNLLLAALLALGRYSVPILPCLWTMAAFGLDTILEKLDLRILAGSERVSA